MYCRYIRLGIDGSVLFFTCPIGTIPEPRGISNQRVENIRNVQVDAETKCEVATFKDGRMILTYANGRRETFYNDGTKITTHSSGNLILVEKGGLPKVEIDVEIDSMCRSHSDGVEVPINKGGERVRSRIAMLDGSAILVCSTSYAPSMTFYLTLFYCRLSTTLKSLQSPMDQ